MYILRCPLLQSAKPNMGPWPHGRSACCEQFPGCTPAEEAALLALLRDWNPRANQVSGSVEDTTFVDTIEAAVLDLLPLLHSA